MANADFAIAIATFDLAQWVLSRGGEQVKDDEAIMQCPRCGKRKLAVNLSKRLWHCWVCQNEGEGRGGLIDLLAVIDGIPRARACDLVLRWAQRNPVPERVPQLNQRKAPVTLRWALPQQWPAMTREIDAGLYAQTPYLAQRRLTLETCLTYRLAIGMAGRWANRLMLPVFERGQLVYWQGRAMFEVERGVLKALNPSREQVGGTTSAEVLFNLDVARLYPRVAICEGPMDAMRAGPAAVATHGKRISQMQVLKLRAAGVKAVDLMWDGPGPTEPEGALPEMRKAAAMLCAFFNVRVVRLPHGDPDDHEPQNLAAWRAQAEEWRG